MFYQKTWDGILASQVELVHVFWGEVLWAGCRGMISSSIVAAVLAGFAAAGMIDIHAPALLLVPPFAFVAGVAFASAALIFTAIVPSIDHMNYPVFLVAVPVGLISNTYFPVTPSSEALRIVQNLNPVYHLSESYRSLLVMGRVDLHPLWLLLACLVTLVACTLIGQRLLSRRVLGE
jgi:lipooligosaccharide transport system permease protein